MRPIDAEALADLICYGCHAGDGSTECRKNCADIQYISIMPTVRTEPVHARWIECDYKHLEHGMIETESNAGLCCSNCRSSFEKKKMTYKQYCAACGAKMDGGDTYDD